MTVPQLRTAALVLYAGLIAIVCWCSPGVDPHGCVTTCAPRGVASYSEVLCQCAVTVPEDGGTHD